MHFAKDNGEPCEIKYTQLSQTDGAIQMQLIAKLCLVPRPYACARERV